MLRAIAIVYEYALVVLYTYIVYSHISKALHIGNISNYLWKNKYFEIDWAAATYHSIEKKK